MKYTKTNIRYLFFGFIFLIPLFLTSQTRIEVINKLKLEISKIKKDSVKAERLFKVAALYRQIDKDSSFFYVEEAGKIASKKNIKSILGKVYNLKGSLYSDLSNTKEALNYYYKAKQICVEFNSYRGLGIVFNKLAMVHRNKYDLDSALFYNYKTIEVFDSLKILAYSLHAKNNIANIFSELGNKKEALKQHKLILKTRDSIKDKRGIMHSFGNIGDIYGDINQYEKAILNYEKGIKVAKELNDDVALARFYNNQASLYTDNNKLKKGLNLFKKSLNLRKANQDLYGVSSTSLSMASILLMTNRPKQAEKRVKESISISKKYEIKDQLQEGYDLLSRLKLLLRENDSSFHYQRLATNLLDSISKETYSKNLAELEVKYQTEKKEKQLLQTRTEKAETELALSKTRTWTFVLIGGLAIVLLLAFAIVQRNKRKHQLTIANQKEQNLQAILFAEEKERTRIARELHDGVVQQLSSVILRVRDVFSKNKISDDNDSKNVLQTLESSNQDIRTLSHQMMPRALSELGLISAIDDLLKGSLDYANINYTFEHFNLKERLSEKIEITLYRIAQELVNNIIKHSKAKSVSVQLINSDENILLLIEDDGIGLDEQKTKKGIGFLNIKSRLEMINGEANFDKSPEKGTLVTVKIKK